MARTVSVKVIADLGQYVRGMGTGVRATRDFRNELDKAAVAGRLDNTIQQASMLGLGLAGVAGAAAKMAMDFDKQMSAVEAATHAGGAAMESLRQAALDAGADTKFSATEAARGIEELAKAGIATKDILSGGLKGALDLAAAGNLDVGEAAETAASAMTQFKLKGADVPHIADLLAAAAGKAQGDVHDMGMALNQAGLVANQMGLSVEDTTGTLAAFASAGMLGSDAGTSLKTAMLMLANPTEKAAGLMEELGIQTYDSQGSFVGIVGLAGQLRTRLKDLSQEQRNAALATIFGQDAIRAASILYEQGASGIQEWINKTDDAGYAAETARIKTDNLAGDIERLTGSIQTLAIESGSGANGGLRVFAQSAESIVDRFGQLPPVVGSTITVLAGLGGVLTLGAAAWLKMRQSNAEVLEELRRTGPMGERAADGLEKTRKSAGRAALAFAALQVAGAALDVAIGGLDPQVDALGAGLQKFSMGSALSGEAARLLGKDMDKLDTALKDVADTGRWSTFARGFAGTMESVIPGINKFDDSLTNSQARIKAIDSALQQMVQSGNAIGAAQIFDTIAKRAAEQGVSINELKKALPGYSGALEVASTSSKTAAGGIDQVGDEAEQSAEQVEELIKQTKEMFSAQMSLDQANIAVAQGWVDLRKELTSGRRTLSLNTEAGRENRTSVLDQIKAVNELRESRIKHGTTLDDANRKYNKDIDGLRRVLIQLGYDKKAVDALIGSYKAIPPVKETRTKTPGLKEADRSVKEYDRKLNAIDREVKTRATFIGPTTVYDRLEKLLIMQQALRKGISVSAASSAFRKQEASAYASGGWTGPGGTHDPAGIVHADEYVIKKSSRRRIESQHPGLLDEMNATGQLPGHAAGGRVWPFPTTSRMTRVPSRREAEAAVAPDFGAWPSSPSAQRGDSGIWRGILRMIRATGPMSGAFGNAYRPGDPKWHGSGRAVDWMGYNQDGLARFLAAKRPLELIHRTNSRDYAYTRGVNKGSFNQALMNAHRNHIHIAMKAGGTIREPILGVGASGASYSFGEGGIPERVVSGLAGNSPAGTTVNHITISPQLAAGANIREAGRQIAEQLEAALRSGTEIRVRGKTVLSAAS